VHIAVRAFGEEAAQLLWRLRDRIRPGDADPVETVLARGPRECRLERRALAQKSRSA
jgi:hypothetical protein